MMNIREAINRGFNLLAIGIVGLAGFAFMPEIFLEKDWDDKIDDAMLLVIGLVGIIWYFTKNNRVSRSVLPTALVVAALAVKIMGVIIEHNDPDSLGDDIGGLILFLLATAFIIYQYKKTKKLLSENAQ